MSLIGFYLLSVLSLIEILLLLKENVRNFQKLQYILFDKIQHYTHKKIA